MQSQQVMGLVLLALLSSPSLLAQSAEERRIPGNTALSQFGTVLANAGDVDYDGVEDFLVGAPRESTNGQELGAVHLYSGATQSLIYTVRSPVDSGVRFGASVSGGVHIDTDGILDFIVGAPYQATPYGFKAGRVYAYSGATGTVIYQLDGVVPYAEFGSSIACLPDLDGDYHGEILVGAPRDRLVGGPFITGSATVFSGMTGNLIYYYVGSSDLSHFGSAVASLGDVDADGVHDFIVGAYADVNVLGTTNPNASPTGSVTVFSGAFGGQLYQYIGAVGEHVGHRVGDAGDVDNDGFGDFMFSALGGNNFQGKVSVHSGATGALIHSLTRPLVSQSSYFGNSLESISDVDGDGTNDLIIGEILADLPFINGGLCHLISGATGQQICFFHAGPGQDSLGYRAVKINDLNQDGIEEIILSSNTIADNKGAIIIAQSPFGVAVKYSTTLAFPHFQQLSWLPSSGNATDTTGTISCTGATPGGIGLLAVSLKRVDQLFFGFLPVLVDTTDIHFAQYFYGYDVLLGSFSVSNISRQIPGLAGYTMYLQCFETYPLVTGSNGLAIELIP